MVFSEETHAPLAADRRRDTRRTVTDKKRWKLRAKGKPEKGKASRAPRGRGSPSPGTLLRPPGSLCLCPLLASFPPASLAGSSPVSTRLVERDMSKAAGARHDGRHDGRTGPPANPAGLARLSFPCVYGCASASSCATCLWTTTPRFSPSPETFPPLFFPLYPSTRHSSCTATATVVGWLLKKNL